MPQIISTPEGWFRTQKRDLHFIRIANEGRKYSEKKYKAERDKLNAWLADKLPHVSVSIIGPSEYSGWIEGGPSYIAADFGSSDIALFNAAWDKGSFWKIETWPFSDWCKRVESASLLSSPVRNLRDLRWWDTPKGILLLDACTQGTFVGVEPGVSLLSLYDGWWRMQQLFPEFSGLEADAFPFGYFRANQNEKWPAFLIIEYPLHAEWNPNDYAKDAEKIRHLKNVIGIPDELPVEIYVGDF